MERFHTFKLVPFSAKKDEWSVQEGVSPVQYVWIYVHPTLHTSSLSSLKFRAACCDGVQVTSLAGYALSVCVGVGVGVRVVVGQMG